MGLNKKIVFGSMIILKKNAFFSIHHGPSWISWRSLAQILRYWGHYETLWTWIYMFQSRFLFCKYLGSLRLQRNGFVFIICIWTRMPCPGLPIFFSQKFDLINLFLRLGHSSLLNVSCAQIFRLVVSWPKPKVQGIIEGSGTRD